LVIITGSNAAGLALAAASRRHSGATDLAWRGTSVTAVMTSLTVFCIASVSSGVSATSLAGRARPGQGRRSVPAGLKVTVPAPGVKVVIGPYRKDQAWLTA
jgi:hypothetical protein